LTIVAVAASYISLQEGRRCSSYHILNVAQNVPIFTDRSVHYCHFFFKLCSKLEIGYSHCRVFIVSGTV